MEPEGRDQKEANLKEALAAAWEKWSDVANVEVLEEAGLVAILREVCIEPLWAVWYGGNKALLEEHKLNPQEQAAAAAFMFFFMAWARDVASRWKSRVDEYQQARRDIERQPPAIRTSPLTVVSQPTNPVTPNAPAPAPWPQARNEIVADADIERVAVTSVTQAHSNAETSGAGTVRASGVAMTGIWRCELRACPKCEKLNGTRENRWRLDSQSGPPLHPNCRCWIEWVPWGRSS